MKTTHMLSKKHFSALRSKWLLHMPHGLHKITGSTPAGELVLPPSSSLSSVSCPVLLPASELTIDSTEGSQPRWRHPPLHSSGLSPTQRRTRTQRSTERKTTWQQVKSTKPQGITGLNFLFVCLSVCADVFRRPEYLWSGVRTQLLGALWQTQTAADEEEVKWWGELKTVVESHLFKQHCQRSHDVVLHHVLARLLTSTCTQIPVRQRQPQTHTYSLWEMRVCVCVRVCVWERHPGGVLWAMIAFRSFI